MGYDMGKEKQTKKNNHESLWNNKDGHMTVN